MGKKPLGFTLERIDVNGNYCKENCIWANWETQSRNRTNNVWLEANGMKMVQADWAKYFKVSELTTSPQQARVVMFCFWQ
jgi:hypothetical protein